MLQPQSNKIKIMNTKEHHLFLTAVTYITHLRLDIIFASSPCQLFPLGFKFKNIFWLQHRSNSFDRHMMCFHTWESKNKVTVYLWSLYSLIRRASVIIPDSTKFIISSWGKYFGNEYFDLYMSNSVSIVRLAVAWLPTSAAITLSFGSNSAGQIEKGHK